MLHLFVFSWLYQHRPFKDERDRDVFTLGTNAKDSKGRTNS